MGVKLIERVTLGVCPVSPIRYPVAVRGESLERQVFVGKSLLQVLAKQPHSLVIKRGSASIRDLFPGSLRFSGFQPCEAWWWAVANPFGGCRVR
jgi:hypothetical protein